ncbi:Isopenicillin N synthase [Burkholderiales bacterium 8X]|nr:Isopenicillin N synthase [Burkholderiales bacterium 8X]
MNESELPIIDASALGGGTEAAWQALAVQVGSACREVGFFALMNHGIPQSLVDAAFGASAAFFAQPLARKQELAIGKLGSNRGYVGLGIEALDEKTPADRKEAFNLIWTDGRSRPPNAWPELPGFRAVMEDYFDRVLALGRMLHTVFARDLGLAPDFFADKLDRPLATLRLLHYPKGSAAPSGHQLGAGTHTDYGNVTLLATDRVAGLEVRRRDGEWIDVPALPGAFVCNIGDCLMRWTNDIYVSTPHRVREPLEERYSIAFFLDPNPDAQVSAIPSCVAEGTAPRHAPILAGDYLQQRFDSTYGSKK